MGELEIHQHVKLFQDGSKSGHPRNFGINAIFTSRIGSSGFRVLIFVMN
ncbi:MAG: hypothetical protein RLZZ580_54 [Cyanobacteriota bacterium]